MALKLARGITDRTRHFNPSLPYICRRTERMDRRWFKLVLPVFQTLAVPQVNTSGGWCSVAVAIFPVFRAKSVVTKDYPLQYYHQR